MMGSLTDGSTETFWESGDEDRNKSKSVTLSCAKGLVPRRVCVHVDNSRDIGVSVNHFFGKSPDSLSLYVFIEVELPVDRHT